MQERNLENSPRALSRLGGVLYLIIIVLGIFEETVVRARVVAQGDAATTADNVVSMEPLWRVGIASEFFLLLCGVGLTLILFVLLRPVSRDMALLGVFFNLVSLAIEGASALYLVAALTTSGDGGAELSALTIDSIEVHSYGFGAALIFFGCVCLIAGHLILRSGYLPKTIGILMQIAGVCYLTNSFAMILAPRFADRLVPAILVPAFVGEASLCLWLLFKGVNVEHWKLRLDEGLTAAGR